MNTVFNFKSIINSHTVSITSIDAPATPLEAPLSMDAEYPLDFFPPRKNLKHPMIFIFQVLMRTSPDPRIN